MAPERGSVRARCTTELLQMLGKAFIGNPACLLYTRHALLDFHVDPDVFGDLLEVKLGNNLVWEKAEEDSHVLPTRHGSVVIIILNVKCEKPRVPGRDDAVYQQFDSRKTGGVGDGASGIV